MDRQTNKKNNDLEEFLFGMRRSDAVERGCEEGRAAEAAIENGEIGSLSTMKGQLREFGRRAKEKLTGVVRETRRLFR